MNSVVAKRFVKSDSDTLLMEQLFTFTVPKAFRTARCVVCHDRLVSYKLVREDSIYGRTIEMYHDEVVLLGTRYYFVCSDKNQPCRELFTVNPLAYLGDKDVRPTRRILYKTC